MGKIIRNGVEYGFGGKEILNLIYPVGIIVDFGAEGKDFNPNVTWAPQQWQKVEDGRVSIASNASYPIGTTGGSTTHKHSTNAHTLTINEMPSHNHPVTTNGEFTVNNGNGNGQSAIPANTSSWGDRYPSDWWKVHVSNTGGGKPHSHGDTGLASTMQPYTAVNRWKRTG